MRSTHFRGATAAAVLVAGSLLAAPAYAKDPPRPYVAARSSVVIPLHGCQSTSRWLDVIYSPGSRVDSAEVVSVRKRGYTFPVSRHRVCGYMDSGTYTIKARVWWSVSRWKTKWFRQRAVRDVDRPFTCTAPDSAGYKGGLLYAAYPCVFDDGGDIGDGYHYYTEDVEFEDDYGKYYRLNDMPSGWRSKFWGEDLDVYPPDQSPVRSDWPVAVTGAVVEGELYWDRYKKRVRRWIKKPTFTVKRVVQVTVR